MPHHILYSSHLTSRAHSVLARSHGLTCFRAALASTVSVDSTAVATRLVGVAALGVAAGERRGVEVRENSSNEAPRGPIITFMQKWSEF